MLREHLVERMARHDALEEVLQKRLVRRIAVRPREDLQRLMDGHARLHHRSHLPQEQHAQFSRRHRIELGKPHPPGRAARFLLLLLAQRGNPEPAPPYEPRRLALVFRLDCAREELARAIPRFIEKNTHSASFLFITEQHRHQTMRRSARS